jgi:competence protein ComEC
MPNQAKISGGAHSGILADPAREDAALQHRVWRSFRGLSSRLVAVFSRLGDFRGAGREQFGVVVSAQLSGAVVGMEKFLDSAGFDRAPWLAVGFGSGIGLWFALDNRGEWLGLIALCLGVVLGAAAFLHAYGRFPYLRLALMTMGLMVAAGCATVWAKSALVGTAPIARAMVPWITGRVLDRVEEPADDRVRLVLATREPHTDRVIRVRVTLPAGAGQIQDQSGLVKGAIVRLRARLMPPAAPKLPGSFDFARAAWFNGISATGNVIGAPRIFVPGPGGDWLARARSALAGHVRAKIAGSAGGIAAVITTGERGGINAVDAQAMRDAGLAHLLVVGGLHVSAVVGLAWLLAIRLAALIPALALRLRLPLLSASLGAVVGIGYTLLTGAEVSTVRACLGSLLVMAALALGRQPLSLRLLAVAAMVVMVLWPEAVAGPSFQMSFGSVLAIIALHDAGPVRNFLAHRDEARLMRVVRELTILLISGMVIDLAMMPIALFHFHRAGLYGALANLVAIPLTTFVAMPSIAVALTLDIVGWGAPAWWLAARTLGLLLSVAHMTTGLPGAVALWPSLGAGRFIVFGAAMLWLGLWRGRVRLLALIPALLAAISMAWLRAPDVLITGDGRNLGIASDNGAKLMILREGRSSFTRDEMLELAGMAGTAAPLDKWPGARCNHDFCLVTLNRGGRDWRLLVARTHVSLSDDALALACAGVDIVIAQQVLLGPCHPALIKADRSLLMRTGGLSLDLVNRQVASVVSSQGEHPWWRAPGQSGYGITQTESDDTQSPDTVNQTADMVKALPN